MKRFITVALIVLIFASLSSIVNADAVDIEHKVNSNNKYEIISNLDKRDLAIIEGLGRLKENETKRWSLNADEETAILTVERKDGRIFSSLSGNVKDKQKFINKLKQLEAKARIQATCELGDPNWGGFVNFDNDSQYYSKLDIHTEICRTQDPGIFQDEIVEILEGGHMEVYYFGLGDADELEIEEIYSVEGQNVEWNWSWFPGYTINTSTDTATYTHTVEDQWYIKTEHINVKFKADDIDHLYLNYLGKVTTGGNIYRTQVQFDTSL